jgi:peptidoglycan hydrolase-like protein with peptidoglycan-binding domain
MPAHKDAIAELLAHPPSQPHIEPHAAPPVHQASLPAAPPAPSAPLPPAAVPAPSRAVVPSTRQVAALQHALSDFGYGQLKQTGVFDAETRAALQRFERAHNLPVTTELSDAVKREFTKLTGRELD